MSTTSPEIHKIQQLAFTSFGLDLRSGKEELIRARLGKLMRRHNLASVKDYYTFVTADNSGEALAEMIDALTTNYTGFFRESAHFDLLRTTILPQMKDKKIRIWSAACSSGEEPYSIAFSLRDAGFTPDSAQVIATDISNRVLHKARMAVYQEEDLNAFSDQLRQRYFLRGSGARAGWFKVKPEFCDFVQFENQNLIQPIQVRGTFDVIFCRNVMIYFSRETQQKVISNLQKKLNRGGYLMIGHSETLSNIQHSLKYISPAVYRSVLS